MTSRTRVSRIRFSGTHWGVRAGIVVVAAATLSGCMGPTYGTGRTAGQQLMDDVDGLFSFAGARPTEEIAYTERRELVRPGNTNVLPPPQAPRADAALANTPEARSARLQRDAAIANSGGPVSPELAAAREALRAEAGPGPDTGFSRTQFAGQRRNDFALSPQELNASGAAFRQRVAETRTQPNQRRHLSEPPLAYRQPAATAPVGDVGVDERIKEARLKREENSLGARIRRNLPF